MASYRIEVSATAEKQLKKLGRDDRVRVLRAVQALAAEPRPPGCRKLHGYDDVYRIRIGRFRVLYSIDGRRIIVTVLKVAQRKDIYRKT
jgi:mRNA interferase RelE/StbE